MESNINGHCESDFSRCNGNLLMHLKSVRYTGSRRDNALEQHDPAPVDFHSSFANRISGIHSNLSQSPARGGSSVSPHTSGFVVARAFRAVSRIRGKACPMNSEMLKFLTQKLKSQSLNEGRTFNPAQVIDDDDRDSGTESDENLDDEYPYGSKTSLNNGTIGTEEHKDHGDNTNANVESLGAKTHEISEHNFDTVSCTSDYERHSLDFDRHSPSDDELVTINKENVAEKRKWSQMTRCCDSASSSDEEVKEFLLNPQPVLLSSSPPKGVQKVLTLPRQVLAHMVPLSVSTVSPRKRHRNNTTSDNQCETDSGTLTRRPCLDFEKMQQVQAFV